MNRHQVVIAGAGPSGMTLAYELKLAGVDVVVVEPRPDQQLEGSRGGGLHSRTIEVLNQRGIADRFLAAGHTAQLVGFSFISLDMSDLPSRHNHGLALWQKDFERILAEILEECGVPMLRGRAITGFTPDDSGVDITLSDGGRLRAGYLVGCDGGRSLVRKTAGIEFAGWDADTSCLIAETWMREEPEPGVRRDAKGVHAIGPLGDGRIRVVVREEAPDHTTDPTVEDLSAALIAARGTDYGVHSPTWISRFTDVSRQAASYRDGRVLLAGDAAHVHAPSGGQGLNLGVQDAVNLGWKLAQVAHGTSPDSLLDSYHAERHPVAADVLRTTMAQAPLQRSEPRMDALRDVLTEMLALDEPRRRLAARMSGLDISYDLGTGHPLLGRRMPDLEITGDDGPTRVFRLLRPARPVLLDLGDNELDITGWNDRVRHVSARYDGDWELPVLGTVPPPTALLIRPDGHVGWVADADPTSLPEALERWCGPPN